MCVYCYDIWRGKLVCLVPDAVCFAGKPQPMVYAPSYTQSGNIYNQSLTPGDFNHNHAASRLHTLYLLRYSTHR